MTACEATIVVGPAHSGKTGKLIESYRATVAASIRTGRWGCCLWITPNQRTAAAIRKRIVQSKGDVYLAPGVMTFGELGERVLGTSRGVVRRAKPATQRCLLRRLIARAKEARELTVFQQIADRPGFITLLTELFNELDQSGLGVQGFARLPQPNVQRDRHRELAGLYAEYHKRLSNAGYVSQTGLIAAAADSWTGRIPGMASHLDLVVIDGFCDFAPPEERLIQALSQISSNLYVSYTLDENAELRDPTGISTRPVRELFASSYHSLHRMLRHLPSVKIESLPERESNWPARDHISRSLFLSPRQIAAPTPSVRASLRQFQIIAASGVHDELEQIARRIKPRLLAGSARPDEFMVVYRSLSGIAERAREVFEIAGIPCCIEQRRTVMQTAVVRTLLGLLQLDSDDWPFHRVLAAVCDRSLEVFGGPQHWPRDGSRNAKLDSAPPTPQGSIPAGVSTRMAAEWIVRELQIASGREALLDSIERLAQKEDRSRSGSYPQSAQRAIPFDGEEAASSTRESDGPMSPIPHFFRERDRQQRLCLAARTALPQFRALADAIEALPERTTARRWLDALGGLMSAAGAGRLREGLPDVAESCGKAAENRQAWQIIQRAFASLDVTMPQIGCDPPRGEWLITRHELIDLLTDVATSESLPPPSDECGRVRILSASSARHVTAKHVFLAGLSEQSFPMAEPADRLHRNVSRQSSDLETSRQSSDRDSLRPQRGDGPVDDAHELLSPTHLRSEMRLFYELINRAQESLTFSHPALDDAAQTVPPSPFLTEVERTLGSEIQIERSAPALSPLPLMSKAAPHAAVSYGQHEQAAHSSPQGAVLTSPAEWRVMAVSAAVRGRRELLAGLLSDSAQAEVGRAITAGIQAVAQRAGGRSFGQWEGILTGPLAVEALSRRFGPEHDWSASQLEGYAACPFAFYMRHVLGLEPVGDLVLETDYRRRGSTLHNVLAEFHRRLIETVGRSTPPSQRDSESFISLFQQVLDELANPSLAESVEASLIDLDRRKLGEWGRAYYEQHRVYDDMWRGFAEPLAPAHFEVRFGPLRHAESARYEDVFSTDEPYLLDLGESTIRITGRIDRLDIGTDAGRVVFNVIDYKTGKNVSISSGDVESGRLLQLPLYTLAAERLLAAREARPLHSGYWSLQGKGFEKNRFLPVGKPATSAEDVSSQWAELQENVKAKVREIVLSIRQGEFPVINDDEKCTSRCEFASVCRVAQARGLNKVWPPVDGLDKQSGRVRLGKMAESAK